MNNFRSFLSVYLQFISNAFFGLWEEIRALYVNPSQHWFVLRLNYFNFIRLRIKVITEPWTLRAKEWNHTIQIVSIGVNKIKTRIIKNFPDRFLTVTCNESETCPGKTYLFLKKDKNGVLNKSHSNSNAYPIQDSRFKKSVCMFLVFRQWEHLWDIICFVWDVDDRGPPNQGCQSISVQRTPTAFLGTF